MDPIYYFIIGLILVLSCFDLVVGVSNDAANFLNSAVGSKAAPRRTIVLVAALGYHHRLAVLQRHDGNRQKRRIHAGPVFLP